MLRAAAVRNALDWATTVAARPPCLAGHIARAWPVAVGESRALAIPAHLCPLATVRPSARYTPLIFPPERCRANYCPLIIHGILI